MGHDPGARQILFMVSHASAVLFPTVFLYAQWGRASRKHRSESTWGVVLFVSVSFWGGLGRVIPIGAQGSSSGIISGSVQRTICGSGDGTWDSCMQGRWHSTCCVIPVASCGDLGLRGFSCFPLIIFGACLFLVEYARSYRTGGSWSFMDKMA